jgi:hypothetical protein
MPKIDQDRLSRACHRVLEEINRKRAEFKAEEEAPVTVSLFGIDLWTYTPTFGPDDFRDSEFHGCMLEGSVTTLLQVCDASKVDDDGCIHLTVKELAPVADYL